MSANSENTRVYSKEIFWCPNDDRHVLVIKDNNNKVIGLNYCQGDDLGYFEHYFNYSCADLVKFYNCMCEYLNGKTEIDRINQAIWARFEYLDNSNV